MKRPDVAFPAISGAWLASLALVLALVSGLAQAQPQQRTLGAENADPPEESSEKVEDSDESYRQRMELRDGFPGQQTRIETTYSKPASKDKIDQLPVASQKHIKDQLREMIIENGQWEPGQDLSDYPYEPSTAAQTDAKLRGGEREAWSEELQKYQEREAEAYAQAMGQGENETRSEGAAGQPGQPGGQAGEKGNEDGATGSPGTDSGRNSLAERNARALEAAAAYQGSSESGEEAVSTAGTSENALSYLQSMNGGSGGPNPEGSRSPGNGQPGGQAGQSDSGENSPEETGASLAQAAQEGSGNQSGEPTAEGEQGQAPTEDLAGTMAVGDLGNLFAGSSQGSDSSSESSSTSSSGAASDAVAESGSEAGEGSSAAKRQQDITYRDVKPMVEIEPGTLTLEELRQLRASGTDRP